MSKTMFDAAFPPSPPPVGFDVAAGYVFQTHGEAAHIWSVAEWAGVAKDVRYLLPIATCWTPFGDGQADAVKAVASWQGIVKACGWKPQLGAAFALDVELQVANFPGATAYVQGWRNGMRAMGYHDIAYSSASGGHLLGSGDLWLGPPASPGQTWGNGTVVIAQQEYKGSYDANTAIDAVPFFDTRIAVAGSTTDGARMLVRTSTGLGYWVVDSTGAVFAYGDAAYHGGANDKPLNAPIISIEATPDDGGYWLLGRDGGVFAFGNAGYFGAPVGLVH